VPRLLIACGHSICAKCAKLLFTNGGIICPECATENFAQSVSHFPKNLALLEIKKKSPKNKRPPGRMRLESIAVDPAQVCSKHNKRIEAFCEKERELLCVTCILEDGHRQHKISSIQKAAEKEKSLIDKANTLCNIIEGKLEILKEEVNK